MIHPEFSDELNEFLGPILEDELVDVWCLGCKDWRKMNSAYAKLLQGEIQSCGKCRES
mgnify:CR=1 FL=1